MIGIAVFTHRQFGQGLIEAAECIAGPQEQRAALSITGKDSLATVREQAHELIKKLDTGEGVLVMTDMLGGTPLNAGFCFINEFKMEMITGVNLPMLISAFLNRNNMELSLLAKKVLEDAKSAIADVREVYAKKVK